MGRLIERRAAERTLRTLFQQFLITEDPSDRQLLSLAIADKVFCRTRASSQAPQLFTHRGTKTGRYPSRLLPYPQALPHSLDPEEDAIAGMLRESWERKNS